MSVLVKGMEMPPSCFLCKLSFMSGERLFCSAMKNEEVLRAKIDPNCPLIEIPLHGRLIDADALSSKLTDLAECEWNQSTGTTWAEAFEEVDGFVQDAPTIIEAEGRET